MKTKEAQAQQKHYYDLRHCQPGVYITGALVLMKDLTRKEKRRQIGLEMVRSFRDSKKSW